MFVVSYLNINSKINTLITLIAYYKIIVFNVFKFQVFLLDHQRVKNDTIVDDERSYIFLLCHHWCNSEIDNQWQKTPERVPYKNIVLGLFVNEMLLQIAGNILVKGTNKTIPR